MYDMTTVQYKTGAEALAVYRRMRIDEAKASKAEKRNLQRANMALRRDIVNSCIEDTLSRILNADSPDEEFLVWFWFNHFNVYWKKDLVGAAIPDYLEQAIRPHVRGNFRSMLQATLTHPAMIVYLDNVRNVAGRINENYARELLELHTLGVDGGYTQHDIEMIAHMLTGVGLRTDRVEAIPAKLKPYLRQQGEFMFNPRKHEFANRELLGHSITRKGFDGVEELLDILVAHPATAHHIAGKLATFLCGDTPEKKLVTRAAETFKATHGDLGKTTAVLLDNVKTQPATSFKDPYRYVISSVRLMQGGEVIANVKPVARWLSMLGQPLFGCHTPDGYSLKSTDWLSSGQMTQRFELASEIVHTVPRQLSRPIKAETVWNSLVVNKLLNTLGTKSRQTIAKGDSADQRLALLLSCPEFMYR